MADPTTTTTPNPTTPNLGVSGIGGGIVDLINWIRGSDVNHANQAAALADPFAAQRGQYQSQLQGTITQQPTSYMDQLTSLLKDPGSFKTDPGYQFALDQGLEGVARHGNAMFGTTRSGNTAVELDKYGTGFAEQAFDTRVQQLLAGAGQQETNYNQQIQSLLTASGATTGSPAAAGALLQGGYDRQNQSAAGGLRGIDQLLGALFGNGAAGNALSGAGGFLRQLFGGGAGSGAAPALDTGGDSYLGLTNDGSPAFQGVPGGDLNNILDPSGTAPIMNLDPGNLGGVSLGDQNLLGDLFGG